MGMKNTVRMPVRHLIFAFRPSAMASATTLTTTVVVRAKTNVKT